MFIYLVIIVVLLCVIHLIFNYNEKARLLRKIPGPKETFIFGNGFEIMVSGEELMKLGRVWSSRWKGIFRLWCFPLGYVNVYNPEDIEILMTNVKYNDKSIIYKYLRPWLRDGLLVSNGEKWHQRRKLLTPAFHFNILRRYYTVLQENSQRFVQQLEKYSGEAVDIVPVISEYTLHSICETAMGTQLGDDSDATRTYKKTLYDLGKLFAYRLIRFYLFFDTIFFWSTYGKATKKFVKILQEFTERVIIERREYIDKNGVQFTNIPDAEYVYQTKKKTAMLDLLLLAEKDGHIDRIGIQEEVDTFMFEGHDTTAAGLTFCFMSIANDKNVQNKIFNELDDIFGDSTRDVTIEDLSKMKYLECCIKESMRLYPPVHFISRHLNDIVELSGYTIPPDTICNIHILDLHRNPDLYKEPLVFDPDRFLPENCVGRHPYAYIPFSAGPRNCIGQKFAMMEMKLAVAAVLRQFSLQPVTRHDHIQFTADLVLRHVGPVLVTFVKRSM